MIILTGTYPPERCGVGDYVQNLLSTPTGRNWTLLYLKGWKWKNLRGHLHRLRQCTDPDLNFQYPTMGYGTSIIPHVLVILAVLFLHKRLYITVHEYSQLGWKGKMALNLLFLFARDVIFTTSFELGCAHRHNPWMRKGRVVKIRSNIPVSDHCKPMQERKYDVGYFGYIRPFKGIEDFMKAAKELRRQGKQVYVMGQTQPEFADFHEPLLRELAQMGITYIGDQSQEEVADIISDTKIMYLPYPDGLSERRGSFLAAVVNGAAVVTTKGAFTSLDQQRKFAMVSPSEAQVRIQNWLTDEKWLEEQQCNSLTYTKESVPASWEQVAEMYGQIIR